MKYIFANWKMYLTHAEAVELAQSIRALTVPDEARMVVFPSLLSIPTIEKLFEDTNFEVGAQNVSWTPKGAYTGAVSAFMCEEAGCTHALVGHSERRVVFHESESDVRKKVEACLEAGLSPVVCIGESKEQKESGERDVQLRKQIATVFHELENAERVILAYEPIWAIGTDDPCDPNEVQRIHEFIKKELEEYTDVEIPVLYGGSVDAKNVLSYISQPFIDGVLIGHASTVTREFIDIIRSVQSYLQK